MTAVATARETDDQAVAPEARLAGALATLPFLAAGFLALFVLYAWEAGRHGSPWLFSDEVEFTQLSRAIAETGHAARRGEAHSFESLYSYVIAPVWWFGDNGTAYAIAKYIGVTVMTSTMFPAYALARMLVSRGAALFVAVASASIPAMAYSRLLVSEPLAYPYSALCLFLMVKALATWSRYWLAGALLAVLVAPYVRGELMILRPGFVIALLIALALSDRARRRFAGWHPLAWPVAAALVAGAVLGASELAGRYSRIWSLATHSLRHRSLEYGGWALGSLMIGVGVLPLLAALTTLVRPADLRLPAYRAYVGVFVASFALFVAYTAAKAAYLSTVFAIRVEERNLIYLSPLLFVGTALCFERPLIRPATLAAFGGAAALGWYLVVKTPFQLALFPYSDAPGLGILAEFNRRLALDDAHVRRLLLWILDASAGLILVAWAARRRRLSLRGGLALVAAAVVAWNLTGAIAFGNGLNRLSNRLLTGIPNPPDWIDRATGVRPTAYVGQGIADPNSILLTEFWNRSISAVGSLDNTAPGPGPVSTPLPAKRDGTVVNDPHTPYLVTNTAGVDVFGKLVERTGDWRLYRIGGQLRLRSAVTGVYPDGWTGAGAAYSRFGEGRRGVLEVSVSRLGWRGPDVPGHVLIRVGTLVPAPTAILSNPCSNGTCVSQQPTIGRVTALRRWVLHSGRQRVFRIPVRTPFRAEISVSPTFSPAQFGLSDLRQLGAQVSFAFDLAP